MVLKIIIFFYHPFPSPKDIVLDNPLKAVDTIVNYSK